MVRPPAAQRAWICRGSGGSRPAASRSRTEDGSEEPAAVRPPASTTGASARAAVSHTPGRDDVGRDAAVLVSRPQQRRADRAVVVG